MATPNDANKVYEMQWDCKFCGTQKLLGKTHRFCPNCGGQQDPSWRYFPSDEEKVAVQDHVYVGADIICPACQSLNAGSAEFCGNCGSPLTDAARAKTGSDRQTAEGATLAGENLSERQKAEQQAQLATLTGKNQSSGGGLPIKWLLIGGVVIAVIIGLIAVFTAARPGSAFVTDHRWERVINIQSLQAVPGSADCDSVPVGAYSIDRRYEQVGSRSVPDGEVCQRRQVDQGDGTFREERVCETKYREEAVYGYVCSYVVNMWNNSREVTSAGNMSMAPSWPAMSLQAGTNLGSEREAPGGRSERYWLVFKGDGDRTFECEVDFELWENTPVEKGFTIDIGRVTNNFRCDTLKPA